MTDVLERLPELFPDPVVVGALRQLEAGGPHQQQEALAQLGVSLLSDTSTAARAIPVLQHLLAAPRVRVKEGVLTLATRLGVADPGRLLRPDEGPEAGEAAAVFARGGAAWAWGLGEPDPRVRCRAAFALGFASDLPLARSALRNQIGAEHYDEARAVELLSLGALGGRAKSADDSGLLTDCLLQVGRSVVRPMAALGLVLIDPGEAPPDAEMALEELVAEHPQMPPALAGLGGAEQVGRVGLATRRAHR